MPEGGRIVVAVGCLVIDAVARPPAGTSPSVSGRTWAAVAIAARLGLNRRPIPPCRLRSPVPVAGAPAVRIDEETTPGPRWCSPATP